ncbi:MAG: hypothetical protein HY080_06145 [Gammaproteobacteria bacterium]|nr:hypothetical protein [Gammaproteobacteria bacterium]
MSHRSPVEKLDASLSESDADSMIWNDGGESKLAEDILSLFSENNWLLFGTMWRHRNTSWRTCLASILQPQQDESAVRMLLVLAGDQGLGIAFEALSKIAFYCGVNDGSLGPFVDTRIRVPTFLVAAVNAPELKGNIAKVIAECAPAIQKRFELLLTVLSSGGASVA